MKKIAILGSTGSIGTQALEVIRNNSGIFHATVLTAFNNAELLIKQSIRHSPDVVVIGNPDKYNFVKESLSHLPVKVMAGADAIAAVAEYEKTDLVLTAMVGFAGLLPTVKAVSSGKTIALANKETMVVAGQLIKSLAQHNNVNIIPVDSEHSAIYQCLAGEEMNPPEKIILTASGGPFRKKSYKFLQTVTKEAALKHPNWDMGNKITIDSASLMNKGLEAIEAKWLFDVEPEQIEVVIHPQSIIHSMVQFFDGSVKAQMGLPDMRLPVQYAFSFPERIKSSFPRLNFSDCINLTFEKPDTEKFRNLAISFEVMRKGGNWPCIMNAANECVVNAFLNDRIGFMKMPDIIEQVLEKSVYIPEPSLENFYTSDEEARKYANELIR
jgi:1-deoxy-D-xylulose-5-phosphate reductoisomerase